MTAEARLRHVHGCGPDRTGTDRLEILTALIGAPSFEPIYRADVIDLPRDHPIYRWGCVVHGCEWACAGRSDLCQQHQRQWAQAQKGRVGRAEFVSGAAAFIRKKRSDELVCRICPDRPADRFEVRLCGTHRHRWNDHKKLVGETADMETWATGQEPLPSFGACVAVICTRLAVSSLGLCVWHRTQYTRDGRPGSARVPRNATRFADWSDWPIPIRYDDETAFRRWCREVSAPPWPGQINLQGLRPLIRAEIKWGLFRNSQRAQPSLWHPSWIRSLVTTCRDQQLDSLTGFVFGSGHCVMQTSAIARAILHDLRLLYFSPEQTKDAGFIESEHFGIKLRAHSGHIDLTGIPQRWLRDLAWEHLAAMLRSPRCPRGRGAFDGVRRAAMELGVFLETDAPEGGHDPHQLDADHMYRFVADQRRRLRDGLPSLAMTRPDGSASTVTATTRSAVCNAIRRMLRAALDDGVADRLGLARGFIVAAPLAGATAASPRRPFPDGVARALAAEANLVLLADVHDPGDRGLRDVWETTVITGRRIGEVLAVRWDCLGRYGGLPMFWHDQTKVGNYDVAIRIPEHLHDRLAERQRRTMNRFIAEHGRPPTDRERARMALFPGARRNCDGSAPMSCRASDFVAEPVVCGFDQ